MVPPHTGQRPARPGLVVLSVARPHAKQYRRKMCRAALRRAARSSAEGSSGTWKLLARVLDIGQFLSWPQAPCSVLDTGTTDTIQVTFRTLPGLVSGMRTTISGSFAVGKNEPLVVIMVGAHGLRPSKGARRMGAIHPREHHCAVLLDVARPNDQLRMCIQVTKLGDFVRTVGNPQGVEHPEVTHLSAGVRSALLQNRQPGRVCAGWQSIAVHRLHDRGGWLMRLGFTKQVKHP